MLLEQLSVQKIRNLADVKLEFGQLNVIYGDNGSGKTSLLEAIHYLALGRSFRTHLAGRVIHHDHDQLIIWGKASGHSIGIQRFRNGDVVIKIDGDKKVRVAKRSGEVIDG